MNYFCQLILLFSLFLLLFMSSIALLVLFMSSNVLFQLGVSTGRVSQVCAQPATDPKEIGLADSQPATDSLRGSGFTGWFADGWHRFQVRPKPDGKHRKTAKIGEISPYPTKIW